MPYRTGLSRICTTAPRSSPHEQAIEPMGTASLQFLSYALVVALVFNVNRSVAWRQFILLAASLIFLGFFTPDVHALIPLLGFLAFGYAGLRIIQVGERRAFVSLLVVAIVAFFWLKKYAFIPEVLFLRHPYVTLGL